MSDDLTNSAQEETLVTEVKEELTSIDSAELNEHAERYETLHTKLTQALSSIEGM